ncbi:MerR family transcriptional regulator [Anaerocolumna xylanovorans]|uniref:DNA-binding transcriptional regulator, MerR family n=1 Tax=Anaerocolumna xylanovorans DSM 12503 TaxID=1121345 RepID=A0A1M7YG31_9FIRM|nr:MerR family transcriptional regulator [Anaerocolumna xylanovorans]SHO51468.1 DNA-binding transcriptional regulator, MerR family [Anaerocolumna xylanovorans DSM 12503]
MEYSILKLSKTAGISTRTLRYYDSIGLLKPLRISSSGYRIYGEKEVSLLQQILFYKELGFGLEDIRAIVLKPDFDSLKALEEHREKLLAERARLDILITTVDKTIDNETGRNTMSDKEKFEGFKKDLVRENEEKYGKEIREKYGDKVVEESNKKMLNLSKEEYEHWEDLRNQINETLKEAFLTRDPGSETAQEAARLHMEWLTISWGNAVPYTPEAHAGLGNMYVADERFKAYYDKEQEGLAEFLRDAIHIYTQNLSGKTDK